MSGVQWGSWGRFPSVAHRAVIALSDRSASLPRAVASMLPYGNGRSYGDVCLNEDGVLLHTRRLDRFIDFDPASGVLRCEAGILLSEILDVVVPQGWFLPVTPGTRLVTVGGAVANDVHGKNHHIAGSFGCHVRAFELLRSDGSRLLCSPDENSPWFAATIGGLGLTGLIVWVELQMMRITSPHVWSAAWRFRNLEEFFARDEAAKMRWPYTVAWVDCLAGKGERGRGVYFAGEHAPDRTGEPAYRTRDLCIPFDPPMSLVNPLSLRLFNFAYYRRSYPGRARLTHYRQFFYPLDRIRDWNRMYGRAGFFQYQCVLPPPAARKGIAELLARIARSGEGSFLAVLKTFGGRRSPGMLSFPRPGTTLALDFPSRGEKTIGLFRDLDAVVAEYGGALYPAKDARMSAALFRRGYPDWERFAGYRDPGFSSSFWRRVTEDSA